MTWTRRLGRSQAPVDHRRARIRSTRSGSDALPIDELGPRAHGRSSRRAIVEPSRTMTPPLVSGAGTTVLASPGVRTDVWSAPRVRQLDPRRAQLGLLSRE